MVSTNNLPEWLEDKFKDAEKLYEGDLSTIYYATSISKQEPVIVKEIRAVKPENYQNLSNFMKKLETLKHPNILPIREIFTNPKELLIAITYPKATSLEEILNERGSILDLDLVTLFSQLLEVLIFAHKQGIPHNSIKPQNVFIEQETCRLADWYPCMTFQSSPAPLLNSTSLMKKSTRTITVSQISYLSPEILDSETSLDYEKSDLYALGLVGLRALGMTEKEVRELSLVPSKYYDQELNDLDNKLPRASKNLTEFLRTLLQRDPALRPTLSQALNSLAFLRGSFSSQFSYTLMNFEGYYGGIDKFGAMINNAIGK